MESKNDLSKWSDYQIWQFTLCPISKARTPAGAKDRKWHKEIDAEANKRRVFSKFGIYANNPEQ